MATLHPNDDRGQSSKSGDSEMLTFGVFALCDIKANEEVVLSWEWDDASCAYRVTPPVRVRGATHLLPVHI